MHFLVALSLKELKTSNLLKLMYYLESSACGQKHTILYTPNTGPSHDTLTIWKIWSFSYWRYFLLHIYVHCAFGKSLMEETTNKNMVNLGYDFCSSHSIRQREDFGRLGLQVDSTRLVYPVCLLCNIFTWNIHFLYALKLLNCHSCLLFIHWRACYFILFFFW